MHPAAGSLEVHLDTVPGCKLQNLHHCCLETEAAARLALQLTAPCLMRISEQADPDHHCPAEHAEVCGCESVHAVACSYLVPAVGHQ